jgi:amino acid permease
VGASIIALPYALLKAGFELAILFHVLMVIALLLAIWLYFETKDNLGFE